MFSKKNLIILGILVFLIIFGYLWNTFSVASEKQREIGNSQHSLEQSGKNSADCKKEMVEYRVSGNSMEPLLSNGMKVTVQENFYTCGGNIERWDIVIYKSTATNGDIIKQVRVIPSDILTLDEKVWTLKINGEILKNSQGEIYHFGANECRFLGLYITQSKKINDDELTGIMQDGAYFIFGDNITNSIDSRKIGAVGRDGFMGKLILK